MPIDVHGKERARGIMRVAAQEFAETNGKSRYDRVWSDSLVIERIGKERTCSQSEGKQRNKSYDEVLVEVLTSQKLWDGSRRLRPVASRITGLEADIQPASPDSWSWSIGDEFQTGDAPSLKKAQVLALQAILVINPCEEELAQLAGLSLAKAR